jgi:hypothetical protein
MPALLRYPGSAGARPCPGRSSLDRACAPAEHGSYREARTGKISQIEVSTLSGEPRNPGCASEDCLRLNGVLTVRCSKGTLDCGRAGP